MIRFAPLIRLDVRHDYHGDAPPPLVLEPDAATERLAARPDLRLRRGDGMRRALRRRRPHRAGASSRPRTR